MDTDWTEDLAPDEAQAALDTLNASNAPTTPTESVELLKLKRALELKVRRGTQATAGALSR
jgi:hypothetical protein